MFTFVDSDDCLSPVCCAPVIEVTGDQGECKEYRSCEVSGPGRMQGVQKLWSLCSMGWDDPSFLHPQLWNDKAVIS